ncbi:MAG: methyltransferase domain-containing protein [Deltaproteobacteria bacterium]|nr:methyltransferase domain-containing protein [Deltaproteobacteria bacterium]
MKSIDSLARSSDRLDKRITENFKGQQIDFIKWIFERLDVPSGSVVLEIACGTGYQTLPLLELVGENGHVFALDVSKDAIEKLKNKIGIDLRVRLTAIESKMEKINTSLERNNIRPPAFDLIFCSYGLYYSENPQETLDNALNWLRPGGKIVIIGPYRFNNRPLFNLLSEVGVDIPPFVMYTSKDFMEAIVIPWAIRCFNKIKIHTMVNYVQWDNPESLIEYWKNTTFYDGSKLQKLQDLISEYFAREKIFTNEKWVMMIEAANE